VECTKHKMKAQNISQADNSTVITRINNVVKILQSDQESRKYEITG
jgi:hypothetical protein